MEAVEIQLHREDHHLLNSRAEFNRSAIPRLGLKLGDNEYKERKKEERDDEEKEETILMKIREMKKKRNKERGCMRRAEFRNKDKEPANKRRKVDSADEQTIPGEVVGNTVSEAEKRKQHQSGGPSKKQRTLDNYLWHPQTESGAGVSRTKQPQNSEPKSENKVEEIIITKPQPASREKAIPVRPEYPSGRLNLEEDMVIDWESKFEEHKRILEEEARTREERIEKSDRMRAGWELAKMCREYIRENSNSWRGEAEATRKQREKERHKMAQKLRAEEQKMAFKQKMTQKKITDTLQEIPHREREPFVEDDLRQRRFQMREMKENLWKWRGNKSEKKTEETAESEQKQLEEKLRQLEDLLKLTRREKEERLRRADKKRDILKSNQTEKMRKEEEKKIKKEKKNRLEDSWGTMRWATNFIEDNLEIWEREEEDKRENERGGLEEWRKMTRLSKVAELRKRYKMPSTSSPNLAMKLKKKRILPAWMTETICDTNEPNVLLTGGHSCKIPPSVPLLSQCLTVPQLDQDEHGAGVTELGMPVHSQAEKGLQLLQISQPVSGAALPELGIPQPSQAGPGAGLSHCQTELGKVSICQTEQGSGAGVQHPQLSQPLLRAVQPGMWVELGMPQPIQPGSGDGAKLAQLSHNQAT
jgi:hypothetical protein